VGAGGGYAMLECPDREPGRRARRDQGYAVRGRGGGGGDRTWRGWGDMGGRVVPGWREIKTKDDKPYSRN